MRYYHYSHHHHHHHLYHRHLSTDAISRTFVPSADLRCHSMSQRLTKLRSNSALVTQCHLLYPSHFTTSLRYHAYLLICFIVVYVIHSMLYINNPFIEFDYVEEARNLDLMFKAIMPRWGSMVQIPMPYTHICSKHILVMECLEGVKLVDGIRSRYKVVAEKMGKTIEQLESEQIALMKSGKFLFKSIEQSKQEQNKIQWYYAMHDYLFNINNLWKTCYNFSLLRLIYGPMEIERTQLPVDLGSLLEVLCNVHADELFGHGAFNGDPHPVSSMLYPHAQQHTLYTPAICRNGLVAKIYRCSA